MLLLFAPELGLRFQNEKYVWLNQIIAVGTGHRLPDGPRLQLVLGFVGEIEAILIGLRLGLVRMLIDHVGVGVFFPADLPVAPRPDHF